MNHSQHPHTAQTLSSDEAARYSRHLLLPEVGLRGQLVLKSSRVLVVGAGPTGIGLGAEAVRRGLRTLLVDRGPLAELRLGDAGAERVRDDEQPLCCDERVEARDAQVDRRVGRLGVAVLGLDRRPQPPAAGAEDGKAVLAGGVHVVLPAARGVANGHGVPAGEARLGL